MEVPIPLADLSFMTLTRLALASSLALAFAVSPAFADAPDPIPSATHGSVVLNADGSRTLTVSGGTDAVTDPGWQWTTHKSDCNTDRGGAGVAIVWNDPTDKGGTVTGATVNGNVTVAVGTATDQVVHPTPLTSPLVAVDIATPAAYKSWRGGCGVYVDHGAAGKWSQGTWGPFTHTYPASVSGALSVCPLMYDVHAAHSNLAPNSADEVTSGGANHNDDNSLQKNGSTPLGNGCFAIDIGSAHLSIVKEVSTDGGATFSH